MRSPRAAACAAALMVAPLALALLAAAPAGAVGPSMMLTVYPTQATGTPTADAAGEANFTISVDLLSDPVGRAGIQVLLNSDHGWSISPNTLLWSVTDAGRYSNNVTVEVPPEAVAGTADQIEVIANYQVGGVTTLTQSTTVHVHVGPYYAGSVKRVTPPTPMDPGTSYLVSFDIRNDGNARATFAFTLPDKATLDRLRATIDVPDGPTIAGQNNTTVDFLVKPGGTSPGGSYRVPVQMEARDRHGTLLATVNFTLDLEVNNLAIYQGVLPNIDTRVPYTLTMYALGLLVIWLALHGLAASLRARKSGLGFGAEFGGGIKRSRFLGVLRGVARRAFRRPPRGKAPEKPLLPSEVKGRSAGRAQRGR